MRYHRANFFFVLLHMTEHFSQGSKSIVIIVTTLIPVTLNIPRKDSVIPLKYCFFGAILFILNSTFSLFFQFRLCEKKKNKVIYKQSSFLSTSETVARHNSKVWSSAWFAQC